MKTKFKKAIAVLMAMLMVFAMSTTAFAASGTGYYEVGSAQNYSNPITVKVVVQSKLYSTTDYSNINQIFNVRLGQTNVSGQKFTVADAMYAISSNTGSGIVARDSSGSAITAESKYIYSMTKDSKTYAPGLPTPGLTTAKDGWMFRVNGKLPIKANTSANPQGTDISETYLKDGDVVHFYWNYPYQANGAVQSVNYLSANVTYTSNSGDLQITATKSSSYFDTPSNNYFWHIYDFATYTGLSGSSYPVTVYDSSFNTVKTGTMGSSGTVTLTGCNLTQGQVYYVAVGTTSYKNVAGTGSVADIILYQTSIFEKFTA